MSEPETTPPRRLTREHCAEILTRLESSLARAGAPINENAKADLTDLRWLASGTGPVFDEHDAWRRDSERTVRGFTDALLVEKTAAALDIASAMPGFGVEARHLRHWRLTARSQGEQQAVDCAYQFDIAAMAHLGLPFPVTIAEPDLRIGEMSVACKQPRKRNGILEAIAEGATQVRTQTGRGLVAVSLQNLVSPLFDGSFNDLRGWIDDQTRAILEPCLDAVEDRLSRSPPLVEASTATGVLGALFTARYLHLDPERGLRVTLSVLHLVNPAADASTGGFFYALAEGLSKGDTQLLDPAHP